MKKKILFVLPGCKTGGVLSSFLALIHSDFIDKYDVRLFLMSTIGLDNLSELEQFIERKSFLSTVLYANIDDLSFPLRALAVILKGLFKVPLIGGKLWGYANRIIINKIEAEQYNYIVSFQESRSLWFVSNFINPMKITWIHCDYAKGISMEPIEYDLYSKYKKIVCVSNTTMQSFLKVYPIFKDRVTFIYNLLDKDFIISKSLETNIDPRFSSNCFAIISVGRLSKVKQFDCIPKIAKILAERNLVFKWYIIGGGGDKGELEKIQNQISFYSVNDNVIYLGAKSNPYPYFKLANVLVSTSISEACPMIFNEAKILGLPIISLNFPSSHEFIEEGRDGTICRIDTIADAIELSILKKCNYKPVLDSRLESSSILKQIDLLFS